MPTSSYSTASEPKTKNYRFNSNSYSKTNATARHGWVRAEAPAKTCDKYRWDSSSHD